MNPNFNISLNDATVKPKLLRNPSTDDINNSRLADFVSFTGKGNKGNFSEIHKWSIEEPEHFWSALWDFAGVIGNKGAVVIEKTQTVPWTRFFPDSQISYAENMLARVTEKPEEPAIIYRLQDGADRMITWQDLYNEVSLWEQALAASGIGAGDYVGVYLPNVPETIIILLAASNLGAIFSSAGMEMGGDDLINRFAQIKPKILITAEGYVHGKKQVNRADVITRVQKEIPGIEKTVIIPSSGDNEFLAAFEPREIQFMRRDFNHPLYTLFSSGSTGAPKCFEHSSGGILLKHICEYQLHCDVRPGDRVFYHATPSWMMWNWLASGLANGAAILMYDGNPFYPDACAQWAFTSDNDCTHHGTAAPIILGWAGKNINPGERYDLSSLRTIMSTGAVLPEQGFEFIHSNIKSDVKIASISGGTDIVGCFVGGNSFAPTYAGQVNGPILAMDIQIWDDYGNPVAAGESGELVCTNSFPSMPLCFLGNEDGSKYESEYFEYYPGRKTWRQGDSIELTMQGQYVIIGRSDATLNQNGVRIGTGVIYDQLQPFSDQIKDFAAVDFIQPGNKQTITILFLAVDSHENGVNEELQASIKQAVKNNVTPYAIPSEIIAVSDILKTPNGKKAEVIMKKIINGSKIPNPSLYGKKLVSEFKIIAEYLIHKYKP